MRVLILVEHDNHQIHASTSQVLAAALLLDKTPTACVIGYGCQGVAESVASLKGVQSVILIDHAVYEHGLSENISQAVVAIAAEFEAILAAATTYGKNILPRVAALLDTAQISDVTRVINQDTFEHPIYAGHAIETVQVLDEKKILTIRTTAFDSVTEQQPPCPIAVLSHVFEAPKTRFIEQQVSVSQRPLLTHAKIVVSGGRGLQHAENFKLIDSLADTLGAAVGASRAAVDAGFVSNDYQVGQTGQVVAPMLYFAIGISGAIQHVAGMKDSKVIVAINKDADAPIFQVADYGLVGDLFVILPQLIELLKKQE